MTVDELIARLQGISAHGDGGLPVEVHVKDDRGSFDVAVIVASPCKGIRRPLPERVFIGTSK